MSPTTLTALVHACVALAIIAAATTLLALGDLTEATAIALYTAALAAVGAGTGITLAAQIPPKETP